MGTSVIEKLIRERHEAIGPPKTRVESNLRRDSPGRALAEISRDIATWLLEHGPAYRSADGSEAYVLEPSARGPSWRHPDAFPYCWNVFPMRPDARCAMAAKYHGYQDAVHRLRDRLEHFGIDPDTFGAPARIVGTKRPRGVAA